MAYGATSNVLQYIMVIRMKWRSELHLSVLIFPCSSSSSRRWPSLRPQRPVNHVPLSVELSLEEGDDGHRRHDEVRRALLHLGRSLLATGGPGSEDGATEKSRSR